MDVSPDSFWGKHVLLQMNEEQIRAKAKVIAEGLAVGVFLGEWLPLLSWSNTCGSREQRRFFRQCLSDFGFLSTAVAHLRERKKLSRYMLRVTQMFGEMLEDRMCLFNTPGFMDILENELIRPESEQYLDCVQMLWGMLEEPSVAKSFAPKAKYFVASVDSSRFDASHGMGCLALLCKVVLFCFEIAFLISFAQKRPTGKLLLSRVPL
jgi:hypothetical protein